MNVHASQAFIEEGRSELSAWEQHLMELQNVVDELRVDAAVCSRMEAHASSRLVLNAAYIRAEKRAEAFRLAKPLICAAARSFCAMRELTIARSLSIRHGTT